MAEVKKQAQGNTNYSIEQQEAQQPSVIGGRKFADILNASGDELNQMVRFMMALTRVKAPLVISPTSVPSNHLLQEG